MSKQVRVTISTAISALLYISLVIATTLTPLAEFGPNANQFNSIGMWTSILFIILLYAIPLTLYLFGFRWAIYVMAVCCGLGLIGFLFILLGAGFLGAAIGDFTGVISVIIISGLGLIMNLLWFMVAFMKDGATSSITTS